WGCGPQDEWEHGPSSRKPRTQQRIPPRKDRCRTNSRNLGETYWSGPTPLRERSTRIIIAWTSPLSGSSGRPSSSTLTTISSGSSLVISTDCTRSAAHKANAKFIDAVKKGDIDICHAIEMDKGRWKEIP